MHGKSLARPRSGEPDAPPERASDILADPWGQIDRWVNEGGAGLEARAEVKRVDHAGAQERERRDSAGRDAL